ncbi:hypothetical protein [Nonomuraea rosea]
MMSPAGFARIFPDLKFLYAKDRELYKIFLDIVEANFPPEFCHIL